jgi:hypothetical protein
MKAQSVEGFIIARAFLAMYKEDGNPMNDNLNQLYYFLNLKARSYARKKYNLNKLVKNAWDDFIFITKDKNTSVMAIPFALRLIIKNPSPDNKLTKIALLENKKWLWKKEQDIVDAKKIVDMFYSINRKDSKSC